MGLVEELRQKLLLKKPEPSPEPKREDFLSTGLTLLNLAITGHPDWGLRRGEFYLLVGDSQAGKTWLMHQIAAELASNSAFDEYSIVFDQPERGAKMDVARYFGQRLADRIQEPTKAGSSRTLDEHYDNVSEWVRKRPTFYALDSEDSLSAEADLKKIAKDRNARKKIKAGSEQEVAGSYAMAKPKLNSGRLRVAHNELLDTGSIYLMVKQTRDNVGPGAMFNPKTRSGGRALTFYTGVELWFSVRGKLNRTVMGKKRVIGSTLRIHVKKNRETGRDRMVEVPFYPSHGLDDVGSMVDFLIEEERWKETKGRIVAPELDFEGPYEKLVQAAEGKLKTLKRCVVGLWNDIEDGCAVKRQRRYQ